MAKSLMGLSVKKMFEGLRALHGEGADQEFWLKIIGAEPSGRRRLIAFVKAGMPEFPTPQPVAAYAEEPPSHQRARELLGRDFHGLDAAQRHFGPYTPPALEARLPLRLSPHLTEENTLQILQECKGTHFLVATHEVALPEIHLRHPDRFWNNLADPWFAQPAERKRWSDQRIAHPWLLVRKDLVPGSRGKRQAEQQEHLERTLSHERLMQPAEFAYAALIRLLETGERICPDHVVRFPVQAAGGDWVGADWDGDRLDFSGWSVHASDDVGSGSVRISSHP